MCEFCYEFNIVKDLNKGRPNANNYEIKYYSCFIEYLYYNKIYSGRTTHHKHELNFCPECGRKLKRENILEKE